MTPVFPEKVWDLISSFLGSGGEGDHHAALSLASKSLRRRLRRRLVVGNCYAVSPSTAAARFDDVRSVTIKGKPHFADFGLVPEGWGGGAAEWVAAMAVAWPGLEEVRLKRMVVGDDVLEAMATAFRGLRAIKLESCEGFTTLGLASVAASCRNLKVLELQENEVEDTCPDWLSHFPESFTSLESLDISCLEGGVDLPALESLVSRCPNLTTLRLNRDVTLDQLANLLCQAPQLVDLGTGSFAAADTESELYDELSSVFAGCKSLRRLSGIWEAVPSYISAIYSVCDGLTSLNLSYTTLQNGEIIKLVSRCKNLQRLLVLDLIEDTGLEAVASSCDHLQELRVFPSDPYNTSPPVALTEQGLITVSAACSNLHSILFFCRQMTNAALIAVANNRPNLTHFRLCIIEPRIPDYLTLQPFDAGFSAIVKSCKNLRRLSLSGLLTDLVFKSIGEFANRLEMLSVAFAGDSDDGLHYILSGCKNLKKLEIRDCPFGDRALLENKEKLEMMRSLWMSSCNLSMGACRRLAKTMPRLNVEAMDEKNVGKWDELSDDSVVEKLYVYRSVAGRRSDVPPWVCLL